MGEELEAQKQHRDPNKRSCPHAGKQILLFSALLVKTTLNDLLLMSPFPHKPQFPVNWKIRFEEYAYVLQIFLQQ